MKALILFSSSDFPLSAMAGAIYLNKHWNSTLSRDYKKCAGGRMYYLGETQQNTRVVAFSCRSGKVMLKNLIETFLKMYDIDTKHCQIVEIKTPGGILFLMGELISKLPTAWGRHILEKYTGIIYPRLVESVKLDCNFQISDN